jgi:hypothetical protein
MTYETIRFGLVDSQGGFIKQLKFELNDFQSGIFNDDGWSSRAFVTGKCYVLCTNGIYILSRNGKDIYVFADTGELIRIITFNMLGEKVTLKEFNEVFTGEHLPENYRKNNLKAGLPERKPIIAKMIIDDLGQLWLLKGECIYARSNFVYMIISVNGEYIAEQTLPIKINTIKNGYAYGYYISEDIRRVYKKYSLKARN